MAQLCYLSLYLGIKIVSCRLLQRMARMEMDWNLKTLGRPTFSSLNVMRAKPLQEHFVYE